LGNHTEVARLARRAASQLPDQFHPFSWAASLARCVPLAAGDATLPEGRRRELANAYSAEAVRLLRAAVEKDDKVLRKLADDRDFDPLRDRADFQKLLAGPGARR